MDGPCYVYFVSFTYHWSGPNQPSRHSKFGCFEVEMRRPITEFNHVLDMAAKIRELLEAQLADKGISGVGVSDLIILHYLLLRFDQPRNRAVRSTRRKGRPARRLSENKAAQAADPAA